MAIGSIGHRGKWAEGKVQDYFKERAKAISFDWYRYPDARAGAFQPAPADFEALWAGTSYLLEVKEVNHIKLLPHKNFDPGKVARCHKRALAGAETWVLVYHAPLGKTGLGWQQHAAWRMVNIEYFLTRQGGSWDLSAFPLMPFHKVMDSVFDTSA